MSKFKLVRNKVPELFERHHGYLPELADNNLTTAPLSRKWLAKSKLEEELAEFIEASFSEGDPQAMYEEAADLYESIVAMLQAADPDCHDNLWEFQATIDQKAHQLGTFSEFQVARITQAEKDHYYNNIKGKVNDEF
jgi:predicted house-cleaning noncanonical NTP pyrophosphatase (MazG superfamily)